MTDLCTTGLVHKVGLENGTYQINVFITVYFIHKYIMCKAYNLNSLGFLVVIIYRYIFPNRRILITSTIHYIDYLYNWILLKIHFNILESLSIIKKVFIFPSQWKLIFAELDDIFHWLGFYEKTSCMLHFQSSDHLFQKQIFKIKSIKNSGYPHF